MIVFCPDKVWWKHNNKKMFFKLWKKAISGWIHERTICLIQSFWYFTSFLWSECFYWRANVCVLQYIHGKIVCYCKANTWHFSGLIDYMRRGIMFVWITRSISNAQTQSAIFAPTGSDMLIATILLAGLIILLIMLIILSKYLKKRRKEMEKTDE